MSIIKITTWGGLDTILLHADDSVKSSRHLNQGYRRRPFSSLIRTNNGMLEINTLTVGCSSLDCETTTPKRQTQ